METTQARTALLVIDMQEAVLAGCADVTGVVTRINDLLRRAREAGTAIVFIQHGEADDPELVPGSPGWQLIGTLDRREGDTVVPKSYRDSFAETGLAAELARTGAQRLVLTGAQSDFCVQTAALSALVRGYDVTLVSDAHTTTPAVLPEGELGAEAVVAFVNSRLGTLRYPGRTVEVLPAAEVSI
ncbi:MAG: cysteine hydrolase family protein [Acidimicrobiales bacterium]|jgi:nicotinamidase-related amidase